MTREEAREELITFIGTFECPSLEAVEVAIEALGSITIRRPRNEKEPRKKRKKEARKIEQESPGTRKGKAERKETKRRSR